MPHLPLVIYKALILGITIVILKFLLFRKKINLTKLREINTEISAADRSKLSNEIIEFTITLCAAFVSFYASYLLQIQQSKLAQKQDAIDMCISSEHKLGQFEYYLSRYIRIPIDTTNKFFRQDSSLLKYLVKRYPDNYKPYYLLDHVAEDQILAYLTPTTYYTLATLEINEKSAIKTTLDDRNPIELRIRALCASYQFDCLRWYTLEAQQECLLRKVDPDSLPSILAGASDSSFRLIQLLNPAFNARVSPPSEQPNK